MEERIGRLQELLEDDAAFYIENPVNRYYLTGFSSSAGIVLVTKKQSYFLVDFRYYEKAKREVVSCKTLEFKGFAKTTLPLLESVGVKKLYPETDYLSMEAFSFLKKSAVGICVSQSKRLGGKLAEMRMIKTGEEVEKIRHAQRLTDQTFRYILQRLAVGRTEIDVMLDMEFYMRKLGSEGVAFDFIVVSGKNSSLPHGVPSDKTIEKGDFVTMDFGAVVDGYRSDMTRTVVMGTPSEEQAKVYETVLQAKNLAMQAIAPGMVCKEIDGIARSYINASGYEGCFGHGLGHGVGLDIHELPNFNLRCETRLQPGMILTVEPGIYLENQFGVRIEDMVEITQNGYNNLTNSDDRLMVI